MKFYLLFYFLIIIILNIIFKKFNFLKSYSGSNHQKFLNKSIPLTGGIYSFVIITYLFYFIFPVIFFPFFLLLTLGLLSDLDILAQAKYRFFLQLIIITFFVFSIHLEVMPTRIDFIDNTFQGTLVSYFFTIFCLMILINGSNFIDGLNGLLIGYFLIILLSLIKLNLFETLNINNETIIIFISFLIFLILLNFSNQLFLGDNGSYSISFFIGYFLIEIYNVNKNISPYFIIILLWYPCFENLFSIIRKSIVNKNPLKPDNFHLHHYLFIVMKEKFNLKDLTSNNLSSLIINLFNFFIIYLASLEITSTYYQLTLLLTCLSIYTLTYFVLKKKTDFILKSKV